MAQDPSGEPLDVLTAELCSQAEAVLQAQAGDIEEVHRSRVAIRRLRSALRVFEPLLSDPQAARETGAELQWLGALLGEVRDRQVQRARFADHDLDTAFLEQRLYDEQVQCEKALRHALRSRRFGALRERLGAWSHHTPVRAASEVSLEDCARSAARKARRRLRAAHTDAELHRARKAAKRARYAAELVGHPRRAERFRKLQDVLGELQDTVVAEQTLHRLLMGASREEAFTLGVLNGRELAERERLRREAHALTG